MNSEAKIIHYPQLSVIVPIYNRKHIVTRALQSLLSQTVTDFECLLVDDGSTDGLEEIIVPEILKRDNWRFLKHKNRGVAWTRNMGIHAALGQFVTFLDSDDEYLPDHLELRMKYMKNHPKVDLIHGGFKLLGPEANHWVVDARDPSKKIHIYDCCVGATIFAKKQVFLEAGGFPTVAYSPEYHFLKKIAGRFSVATVDYPTYIYHTEGTDRICFLQQSGLPNE